MEVLLDGCLSKARDDLHYKEVFRWNHSKNRFKYLFYVVTSVHWFLVQYVLCLSPSLLPVVRFKPTWYNPINAALSIIG